MFTDENLNNRSYICEACWQELHNFHNFYLKIEKAHLNLNILIKLEVVSEDVLSHKDDLAEQTCIDSNENSEIQPKILFVKEESPLEIFDVEEESCFEGKEKDKKEKYATVINTAEHKGDDDTENSQIQPKVLFVKEEYPLEIFDVEEESCFERKEENATVIIKPKDKRDLAEQICMEDKETSKIESEILFSKQDNPSKISEKEYMGEVSSLKNTTKRKQPLRKNIAKTNPKKRLKKEKGTKPKDNKNRDEETDIKLKEVGNYPKGNKLNEHFNDKKDIFGSDSDPSSSIHAHSSKLEKIRQAQDKFIAEHFQITCSLCDIPLATFGIMAKHYKEEHNQRGYASCCDQKLFARLEIVEHIKFHQNPEYFKCKLCDRKSTSRSCLRLHIKKVHKKENVECDICGKILSSALNLRTHKLQHDGDNINKEHCEKCNKSYPSKDSLNSHMRHVHLKQHKICDLCGKSEKSNYRLKIHTLLQHNEKGRPTVSCKVCGRVLSDMGCLKVHMSSNHPPNGIKPEFKCTVCKKIFTRNANLKTHVWRVHENKYERKCTLCEKTFKRVSSLRDHMSQHIGNPLHACSVCSKTFYTRSNMHAHHKAEHPIEWQESVRKKFSGNLPANCVTKPVEN